MKWMAVYRLDWWAWLTNFDQKHMHGCPGLLYKNKCSWLKSKVYPNTINIKKIMVLNLCYVGIECIHILYAFNYCDVISKRVESPEMNAKIKQRLTLRHHNFFLAGYQAKKVCLCSVDGWIQTYLNSPLMQIILAYRMMCIWLLCFGTSHCEYDSRMTASS